MNDRVGSRLRIAADIGGTFTDVATFDERTGAFRLGKTLSTPAFLMDGIQRGVDEARAGWEEASLFLHGSTVAINTMLERTGAKVALLTTEGFRDIYEIGRINRPDSFNLFFRKHVPLVERALRFEISERLMADGSVRKPLDMAVLPAIADRLEAEGVGAIAIVFLHAYRNPAHEVAVKDWMAGRFPAAFITASHEICREYREFERTSTVAANAYIGPRIRTYLGQMEATLDHRAFAGRFMVVQSTGGLYAAGDARSDCVRMMESGPAAGVIGTQALCQQIGLPSAIAFDMGGTTAKAGVILDGQAVTSSGAMIGGYQQGLPLLTEMVDIHEVGTGGGSIAVVNATGALRVGPQSAGAEPGPACYGRGGTRPTVTDANLLLGRLLDTSFLGGHMPLDTAAAERAMAEHVAGPLGLSVTQAATGVLRIASSNMSHAVRGVTTERGLDASGFPALVGYGGAGPLHATLVARELRIPRVIIPLAPGHFSAFGMLLSDLRYDYVRSLFAELAEVPRETLAMQFREMEEEGRAALARSGLEAEGVTVTRSMDMRYVGQEHAVTVALPAGLLEADDRAGIKRRFDDLHAQRYGRGSPHELAQIVSLRSTVTGLLPKPPLARIPAGDGAPASAALRPPRRAYFEGLGWVEDCSVLDRTELRAGDAVTGPALVEEHASTTVLLPGDRLTVDPFGNLVIEVAA